MFRHKQYAFLSNFVEYFLGYHWERLDSYAVLLKLTYSQMMNMLREDGRLMQTDIFSYDYHDRIELASWVNRLLIDRYKNKKDMFDTIIGKPLKSKLNLTNFSHIEQVDKISLLLKNFTKQKEKGINVLLYGDVGSGKTEFAKVLAQENNLKLYSIAEDMGESCNISYRRFNRLKAISQAFCKEDNIALMFDEGDSFLQDRTHATKSWEITQVNEMLTQMEIHPYPFICTTNLMTNIDKASLRRFTFKIKYDYMTGEQIDKAFKHFFGMELNENIMLELTAGDFCVVKKKAEIMGVLHDKDKLIKMLNAEQESREPTHKKIGFI